MFFTTHRYAKLKMAVDEIQAVVSAAKEERRGARSGGLGSGVTEDRRDRDRERDRDKEKDRKRDSDRHRDKDRSEQR